MKILKESSEKWKKKKVRTLLIGFEYKAQFAFKRRMLQDLYSCIHYGEKKLLMRCYIYHALWYLKLKLPSWRWVCAYPGWFRTKLETVRQWRLLRVCSKRKICCLQINCNGREGCTRLRHRRSRGMVPGSNRGSRPAAKCCCKSTPPFWTASQN